VDADAEREFDREGRRRHDCSDAAARGGLRHEGHERTDLRDGASGAVTDARLGGPARQGRRVDAERTTDVKRTMVFEQRDRTTAKYIKCLSAPAAVRSPASELPTGLCERTPGARGLD